MVMLLTVVSVLSGRSASSLLRDRFEVVAAAAAAAVGAPFGCPFSIHSRARGQFVRCWLFFSTNQSLARQKRRSNHQKIKGQLEE
jgi:hypothetical protein